jgi:hypothetical protein
MRIREMSVDSYHSNWMHNTQSKIVYQFLEDHLEDTIQYVEYLVSRIR